MSSSFMSPNFVIGWIRIGAVESASCINMGNNWPTAFESNQKTVQGFGSVAGDSNQIVGTRSFLNDADFLDMLNLNNSDAPEWLQNLLVNEKAPTDSDTMETSVPISETPSEVTVNENLK